MKFILLTMVMLFLQGCKTTSHTPSLEITIEKADSDWFVMDVSQREEVPDHVFILNGRLYQPEQKHEETTKWIEKFVKRADVFVIIKNISDNEINLFEEWNSWGYYNLKFVFDDSVHEYWVTKKAGLWYRNFPSWKKLNPGESFKIPVSFSEHIWSGLDDINKNRKRVVFVRALYEQHKKAYKDFPKWQGSVSSKLYQASTLFPKKGYFEIPKTNVTTDVDEEELFEEDEELF